MHFLHTVCAEMLVYMRRCAIQRKHDQQVNERGSKGSSTAADLSSFEVPQPDVIPKCKAMIGFCQAMAVWMSCSAAIIQRLVNLNQQAPANQKKQRPSAEASHPVCSFALLMLRDVSRALGKEVVSCAD